MEESKDLMTNYDKLWRYMDVVLFSFVPKTKTIYFFDKEKVFFDEKNAVINNVPEYFIANNYCKKEDFPVLLRANEILIKGIDNYSFEIRLFNKTYNDFAWYRIYAIKQDENYLCSILSIEEEKKAKLNYEQIKENSELVINDHRVTYCVNLTSNKIISQLGKTLLFESTKKFTTPKELYNSCLKKIKNKNNAYQFATIFKMTSLTESFNAGKNNLNFICEYVKLDKTICLKHDINLVCDPESHDLIMYVSSYDVTDEVKLKELLHSVVDHEFDYIARVDAKTNKMLMYTNISLDDNLSKIDNYVDYYNYLHEKKFLSKKVSLKLVDIISKLDDKEKINEIIEFTLNGKTYVKSLNFAYIDKEDKIFSIVQLDVTDSYTKEIQKNEALKEALNLVKNANNTKAAFLNSMSLEIKKPLRKIVETSELCLKESKNNEQQKDILTFLKSNAEDLEAKIGNIIDMNRTESHQLEKTSASFNIQTMLYEVLDELEYLSKNKKIRINFISNIINKIVVCDKDYLKKIAKNIISNAIKYSYAGETVDITLKEELKTESESSFLLEVRDYGCGICEKEINNIFIPFYRGKEELDDKSSNCGIGLGLSISKALVDSFDGDISIESQQDKGTSVKIKIDMPLANKNVVVQKSIRIEENYNFVGKKILIAEDNKINALLTKRLLQGTKAEIIFVDNGMAAYNTFVNSAENEYSAIIMDSHMPIMNGFEASRSIRTSSHEDAKAIPIIIMAANMNQSDLDRYRKSDINAVIRKPLDTQVLYDTLKKIFRGV